MTDVSEAEGWARGLDEVVARPGRGGGAAWTRWWRGSRRGSGGSSRVAGRRPTCAGCWRPWGARTAGSSPSVWLRDVLGTLDHEHRPGEGARIERRAVAVAPFRRTTLRWPG